MRIPTGKGSISRTTWIAILSISAVISLPGLAVSPIMGRLDRIFPHVSDLEIQMLTSLPSLMIIPFILLSGRLSVGRNKMTVLIWGLSLFFLSGILYFPARTMTQLVVISALLGVGAGMMIPFSTGVIVDYFVGPYRTRQLGLSSAVNNLTLVVATALAGWLARYGWHAPFVVYLLPGITLCFVLYLRRRPPSAQQASPTPTTGGAGPKQGSGPSVRGRVLRSPALPNRSARPQPQPQRIDRAKLAGLMGLHYFITYLVLAVAFDLPFLAQQHHMGSTLSGVMTALFYLSIMAPGLVLNRLLGALGGRINLVAMAAIAVGLAVMGAWPTRATLMVGCILTGAGYGAMQPLIYDKASLIAPARKATLSLSFVMSVNNLAILSTPFLFALFAHLFREPGERFPFLLNAAIAAVAALYTAFRPHGFTLGIAPAYYAELEDASAPATGNRSPHSPDNAPA